MAGSLAGCGDESDDRTLVDAGGVGGKADDSEATQEGSALAELVAQREAGPLFEQLEGTHAAHYDAFLAPFYEVHRPGGQIIKKGPDYATQIDEACGEAGPDGFGVCTVTLAHVVHMPPGVTEGEVLAAIYGDWSSWSRHSVVAEVAHRSLEDDAPFEYVTRVGIDAEVGSEEAVLGGLAFEFAPLGAEDVEGAGLGVRVELGAPRRTAIAGDDDAILIPLRFAGPALRCVGEDCRAQLAIAQVDGRTTVVEEWMEVEVGGELARLPDVMAALQLLWGQSAAKLLEHLGFEDRAPGDYLFNTGWAGLADQLVATHAATESGHPTMAVISGLPGDPLRVQSEGSIFDRRHVITGGTQVESVDAPAQLVLAALFPVTRRGTGEVIGGDWGCWWDHGKFEGVARQTEGERLEGQTYDLTPLNVVVASRELPALTAVHEDMHRPIEFTADDLAMYSWTEDCARAWRIKIDLQGSPGGGGGNSFSGDAHYDVCDLGDGTTRIVARFDEVEGLGIFAPWLGAKTGAYLHARAEQGKMIPAGTGVVGLVALLEDGRVSNGLQGAQAEACRAILDGDFDLHVSAAGEEPVSF